MWQTAWWAPYRAARHAPGRQATRTRRKSKMLGRSIAATLFALALPAAAAAADAGKPDSVPDAEWAQIKNLIDPSAVKWHPYKGLAVKQDGTPFKVLDLRLWMGDDYQVAASGLLKAQLEEAGAQ